MIHGNWSKQQHRYLLLVDGVPTKFLPVCNAIKVSIHIDQTLFYSYKHSWGTMVILPSHNTFTVKETSLLT